MSMLEELIQELCLGGVEYKNLGDVCTLTRGRVMSKDYLREFEGEYPVYSSQTANNGIFGYINTYDYDFESITWTTDGANAGSVFYHEDEKFSITNVCGLIRVNDQDTLSVKFVYHFLHLVAKTYVSSGMGNPKLMSNTMARIVIPLPPLPVQEEIVRILDNFTQLTAELTAELTARKKQYEFYRNFLLDTDDNVQIVELGEVTSYSKDRIAADKLNSKNYVGVDNLLQDKRGKTESSYVPNKGMSSKFEIGDILIGNIRPYLKKIWLASHIGGTNGDVLVIRVIDNRVSSEYLYQLLSSDSFFAYNMQNAKGAKMPRGSKDAIMKYKIPLHSLKKQARIVSILDRFDMLCNNLTSGLPAEIEARQKQYEYYRDKLLTFKEVEL